MFHKSEAGVDCQLSDESIGGSVTVGAGVSASANVSQQKMKSEFASVMELSGMTPREQVFPSTRSGWTRFLTILSVIVVAIAMLLYFASSNSRG